MGTIQRLLASVDTPESTYMSTPGNGDGYRGPTIPPVLAENLRIALDLESRPETFGAWVDAMAEITEREGIEVDLETLCTTQGSSHLAKFGETTQHYQCAQDAFIVPFLAEDVDTVSIETQCPTTGQAIEIEIIEDTATVDPPTAVISFGVAKAVDPPPRESASPVRIYELICPYGHAFVSEDAYEEWAAETRAYTMPTSVEDTLELARALGAVV